MTQHTIACPYLGLAGDRTTTRTLPDTAHRCYAQRPAGSPETGHQIEFCLSAGHTGCRFFAAPAAATEAGAPVPEPGPAPSRRGFARPTEWRRYLPWAALGLLLVIVAAVYIGDLLRPPAATPTATPTALLAPTPAPTVTSGSSSPTAASPTARPEASPAAAP